MLQTDHVETWFSLTVAMIASVHYVLQEEQCIALEFWRLEVWSQRKMFGDRVLVPLQCSKKNILEALPSSANTWLPFFVVALRLRKQKRVTQGQEVEENLRVQWQIQNGLVTQSKGYLVLLAEI